MGLDCLATTVMEGCSVLNLKGLSLTGMTVTFHFPSNSMMSPVTPLPSPYFSALSPSRKTAMPNQSLRLSESSWKYATKPRSMSVWVNDWPTRAFSLLWNWNNNFHFYSCFLGLLGISMVTKLSMLRTYVQLNTSELRILSVAKRFLPDGQNSMAGERCDLKPESWLYSSAPGSVTSVFPDEIEDSGGVDVPGMDGGAPAFLHNQTLSWGHEPLNASTTFPTTRFWVLKKDRNNIFWQCSKTWGEEN